MKVKQLLMLVVIMFIQCVAKAQFYDSADDIYYYVEYKDGNIVDDGLVVVFNFDGKNASELGSGTVQYIKSRLKEDPTYYEKSVETSEYDFKYVYYTGTAYQRKGNSIYEDRGSSPFYLSSFNGYVYKRYVFSSDRSLMYDKSYKKGTLRTSKRTLSLSSQWEREEKDVTEDIQGRTYKRVDKSYFRVGRSRTPSGTLHE